MGLETVPAERLGEIVGKTALTDLAAGGLLGPGSFGEPVVAAGAVRVGLRLDPGRLPNSSLPAGTGVRPIPVGRDGAAAATPIDVNSKNCLNICEATEIGALIDSHPRKMAVESELRAWPQYPFTPQ